MGICKITQINSNNQLVYQEKLDDLVNQQNTEKCQQQEKSPKIKVKTPSCNEQNILSTNIDFSNKKVGKTVKYCQDRIIYKQVKHDPSQTKDTINKNEIHKEESSFLFSMQKENTQTIAKKMKKSNRNSSIQINGDFLKIKQKQAISQYKVLSKITNKQIGQLYKVLDKTTSQVRSLQIIKQDNANIKTLHQINLLKRLDHPHIFHLYDVFIKKGFYYIIGQYIKGDNLLCLTRNNQIISEKKLSKIILQILQALNYLHFRGIMHRSIKPQTIVFQQKINFQNQQFPAVKLINFKKAAQISLIKQKVGNTYFAAPQTHLGGHNQKCDVWSVGVILYMLAMGQLPFQGQSNQQIKNNILNRQLQFSSKKWQNKSIHLRNLLKNLLHKLPQKRFSAKQALCSKWFQQASQKDKILISKGTMRNLLNTGVQNKFKTLIKTYLVKMTTSVEERQQMAKKFQSLDKDKSGYIDKKQLIQAYKTIHGQQISKDVDLDSIVDQIDVNKSGTIDFSEFMASISKVQTLFARQRLQKAFQYIDMDGTGQIQISQLMDLLNAQISNNQQNEEDEQIAQILKQFDINGDKTISKQQFIEFFLKLKDVSQIKSDSKFKVNSYGKE